MTPKVVTLKKIGTSLFRKKKKEESKELTK